MTSKFSDYMIIFLLLIITIVVFLICGYSFSAVSNLKGLKSYDEFVKEEPTLADIYSRIYTIAIISLLTGLILTGIFSFKIYYNFSS